jgi:hypothetical protein
VKEGKWFDKDIGSRMIRVGMEEWEIWGDW